MKDTRVDLIENQRMFNVYQSTSQLIRVILKGTFLGEGQKEKEIEHGRSFTRYF